MKLLRSRLDGLGQRFTTCLLLYSSLTLIFLRSLTPGNQDLSVVDQRAWSKVVRRRRNSPTMDRELLISPAASLSLLALSLLLKDLKKLTSPGLDPTFHHAV